MRNVARQHHAVIPTTGGYIAVGSYDDQVRLISSRTWKCVHVLPLTHPDKMTGLVGNTLSFYSEQYTDNLASDVATTSVYDTSTDEGVDSTLLLDEVGHFPLVFGVSDKCLCFNCDTWTH